MHRSRLLPWGLTIALLAGAIGVTVRAQPKIPGVPMPSTDAPVPLAPSEVSVPEKMFESLPTPKILPPELPPNPPEDQKSEIPQDQPAARFDAPIGFTGPSSVVPRSVQQDEQAFPMEDRWRIGFPNWDRYGKGHPRLDDYPFMKGHWWDPYNQNVLKGDYPILGQNTFLTVTATSLTLNEYHEVPIPTTPFESTARIDSQPFFGRPNQYLFLQYLLLSFDLFHGDTSAFRPFDWRVKVTPIFNVNYLAGQELGITSPDVRQGVDRGRTFMAIEEYFVETKLADLGPNYDFVSMRAGSQFFTSDFRGFIFSDTNRAIRLFGNRASNREQFNLVYFLQAEKDTNSGLNTFNDRSQQVFIANYYIQDFIFPGYTTQFNAVYNHDNPTTKFDKNNFLVRPDPVGTFQPHRLDVLYLGWTGDGHIERFNINHALYWATGRDSMNNLANEPQDISAYLGALELSYDRDWARFRASVLWASGDHDPQNSHACGFDGIFDNPNFAGGEFTYWQRQSVRLFGVNLVNRESFFPNLRSSKIQGQSNFVNPGLFLTNLGVDFEVTPRLRLINNCNFMWFDTTEPLKLFVYQQNIDAFIGTDLSSGFEYRPLLNNNMIVTGGVATLLTGTGFHDLYDNITAQRGPLLAAFMNVALTY